jgi:hypothetical protein
MKKMPKRNREDEIKDQIEALNSELDTIEKNRRWTCPWCKKQTAIAKLDVVSSYYLQDNYDSKDWTSSGEYRVLCPKCDKVGRSYTHASQYNENGTSAIDYDFIVDNLKNFGSVIKLYRKEDFRGDPEFEQEDEDVEPVQINLNNPALLKKIDGCPNTPHLSAKATKIKNLKAQIAAVEDE